MKLNSGYFSTGLWCVGCQKFTVPRQTQHLNGLCEECYLQLPWYQRDLCFFCGHLHLSGECSERFGSDVREYRAIFNYHEPISEWISALKYSRNLAKGRLLKTLVNQWFYANESWVTDFDVMVPIPIHYGRLRLRGFNQTSYLIRDQTIIPTAPRLIIKTRRTLHQASLPGKKRFSNLQHSFKASPQVKGKRILLFDDVCTTGQTLDQVAYQLKKSGAQEICAVSLARTQSHRFT